MITVAATVSLLVIVVLFGVLVVMPLLAGALGDEE